MRHAILGAGAVGGLIGTLLAKLGNAVQIIVQPEKAQTHPRELTLENGSGTLSVPVDVIAQLDQPVDVLWVTVKALQLEAALGSIKTEGQIGAVVPLLNGIDHIDLLRNRFGDDLVIPATIAVEAALTAPGKVIQRSPFVRMNLSGRGRERLTTTAQQLNDAGVECKFVDNEETLMWSKLVFLAPFALCTAVEDVPIGEIVSNPIRWSVLTAAVRETCVVAAARGALVNPDLVIATIKSLPPTMRSSMQNDLNKGKTPELQAIVGPILRGAESAGANVNVIRMLEGTVRAKAEQT
jgi:2-dehydropantoate 2-reductase